MAHHDDKIRSMFDDTLTVLGGGAPSTTPEEGVNLVEDWISIVRTKPETQWVEEPLAKLRDALDASDLRQVEIVLRDLAGQTADLGDNAADGAYKVQVQNLATALKSFAQAMAK